MKKRKEYQMSEGALEEAVAAAVDVALADAFSDAIQASPGRVSNGISLCCKFIKCDFRR